MSFATIQLDQRTSLYFEFNDSEEDRVHLLAVAEGLSARQSHETFLRELFQSNGETFNTGVLESPPSEVTSSFSKSILVENFLLGATRPIESGSDYFWEEVLQITGPDFPGHVPDGIDVGISTESGRRTLMGAYIEKVLRCR